MFSQLTKMLFSLSNCEELLYRISSLINIIMDEELLHFILFRKMEWTDQHDVLFCRVVIAFELFTRKPGSKERGQCYDRIAESLSAVKDVYFKLDQRPLRCRITKLVKLHVSKRNRE